MKSFLILLSEKQPDLLNDTLLKAHIDYLKKLRSEGHLPFCGPFTDNQGAVLMLRVESQDKAKEIIQQDPFIKNNYYKNFLIQEFVEAGEENAWLANSNQTVNNLKQSNLSAFNFLASQGDKSKISKQPQTMSVLFRKLKNGETYDDFRQAWLPPVDNISCYFAMPVLVINSQNVKDPSEIISVGLVWADVQEAIDSYEHYKQTEEVRHEKIEKVTDPSAETRFCKIVNIDVLGS